METLFSLLPPNAIVTSKSNPSAYKQLTTFWASQINQHPHTIIVPPDTVSLAKAIRHLYHDTDLDFAIRGHGYTSLPSKDVLISLQNLDSFEYDSERKTITVGTGQTWMSVYQRLNAVAPGYTVVGARTPCVSVGGTVVTAGFSWLSGDLGCISDPFNMLDCEVVKHDGSIVWASSESDLLWAIRGGGGGFGAVTKAIFRLHPTPDQIYSGNIVIPQSSLPEALRRLSQFSSSKVDNGVSLFVFIEKDKFKDMHKVDTKDKDAITFQVFDRHGESHGRETFAWALSLAGAKDLTRIGSMLDLIKLQDRVSSLAGTSRQYWAPLIVPEFSESQLASCVKWFIELDSYGESISNNTYMVFELFCTTEATENNAMAWPGPRGCQHMLVIGVGCAVDAPPREVEKTKRLAERAPKLLMGNDPRITPTPNAIEEWSDMKKVYGTNFDKLSHVFKKYNPQRRFKGHIGEFLSSHQ